METKHTMCSVYIVTSTKKKKWLGSVYPRSCSQTNSELKHIKMNSFVQTWKRGGEGSKLLQAPLTPHMMYACTHAHTPKVAYEINLLETLV